jgi:nitrous oxidase accessory protein NosD
MNATARIALFLFVLGLCGTALFLGTGGNTVHAATITVDDDGPADHSRIQHAVENATAGDTVRVYDGIYREVIVIDKELFLIGGGNDTTTIESDRTGDIVRLSAGNIHVSGFAIRRIEHSEVKNITGISIQGPQATVENCLITRCRYGIRVVEQSDVAILSSTISNSSLTGVHLDPRSDRFRIHNSTIVESYTSAIYFYDVKYAFIDNCTLRNNSIGMDVEFNSNHTTVLNCNFIENRNYAIRIILSSHVQVISCDLQGGWSGVIISRTDHFSLIGCTISDSQTIGIYLEHTFNTNLSRVSLVRSGFQFIGEVLGHFQHSLNEMTIDGKEVLYLDGVDHRTIDGSDIARLILVDSNNITVRNLELSSVHTGILTAFCDSVSVRSCSFSENWNGMRILYSTRVEVIDSTFTGNGLSIETKDSHWCSFSQLSCSDTDLGIAIYGSNTSVVHSTFVNSSNGISLNGDDNTAISNTISRCDNGIGGSFGNRITIAFCTISNGGIGIMTYAAYDSIISHCSLRDLDHGIRIGDSSSVNLTISHCTITGCGSEGILLYSYIQNVTILYCNLTNNTNGVYVNQFSSNNLIHHNVFSGNTGYAAYDEGENQWDAGDPLEGNYWDIFDEPGEGAYDNDTNGIIDDPFSISGGTSQDRYPLAAAGDTTPPVAVADPDQEVPPGTTITFNGLDSHDETILADRIWTFTHNGTDQELHGSGSQFTFWEAGQHLITLTAVDGAGNKAIDTMWVNVTDTIPPIANAGENRVVALNETFTIDGSGSRDDIGIVNWTWTWSVKGTPFTSYGAIHQITVSVLTNIQFTLSVRDAGGNTHSDTIWVLVTESGTDTIPPIAVADSDKEVTVGTMVTFEGITSSDETLLVDWIWTFTHNGTLIERRGYGARFTFWEVGTHVVTLTVRDAAGNTDTDTMNITVKAAENGGSNPENDEDDGIGLWILLLILLVIAAGLVYMKKDEILDQFDSSHGDENDDVDDEADDQQDSSDPLNDNDA